MLVSVLVIGVFVGFVNFGSENVQGTPVSGPIITDTTWNLAGSPYIVVGDVTVVSGVTLTIEPRVEVKFDGGYSIYVDGTLIAVGTETDRIIMTSNKAVPAPGDWHSIRVTSTGNVEIKYCDVSYSSFGIYLFPSSNNAIVNNTILYCGFGIYIWESSNNTLVNNTISYSGSGIYVWESSNNNIITNNNVSSNINIGIGIGFSSNNIIINNTVLDNGYGIYLDYSSGNNIANNYALNNYHGIYLRYSSGNNIINNNASNNGHGIYLDYSGSNNIVGNTMIEDGISINGPALMYWNTHNIDTSNTVNGKPVYYWKNQTGGTIPPNAGQVILANCTNVRIEYQELTHSSVGIELGFSSNNYIIGNNASSNNYSGIYLYYSGGNNITGNNATPNNDYSIYLYSSNGNNITGNNASNNYVGIYLYYSDGNNITGNNASNNYVGIELWLSSNNNITNNTISSNNKYGIDFIGASSNTIDNCTITSTITNNPTGVHFDGQSVDNIFINSSISTSGIYDFHFDNVFGGNSHATTLNTTFDKSKVYYEDTLSDLVVKWFMHVHVIYYNGTPVSNAEIWVNDTFGANILSGQADSQGWARWIVVTEYIEQDINGDHIGDRFYFTPHDVTATDGNLWGYADPNMDISKVVLIILGKPPPLLPPTNLTTKVVNNGKNVELEWDPPSSLALDHYLIYRADSAMEFDFTTSYNSSTTWPDPKNNTWIDPDPGITTVDDDFYYIVRAANAAESDVSLTSNTAGVWTRTFEPEISTFSLPLEPFVKKDTEFYCQDMNASYIKWMNQTTHTWMRHDRGSSENNSIIEIGKGYEIGFLSKSIQTKYTFTGMPGAMILYDNIPFGFDATPLTGNADSLMATVDSGGNITLNWTQPANMGSEDRYYVLRSTSRDGFWGTVGVNYTQLVALPFDVLSYQDIGNASAGTEYYYMIVPVNLSTRERGVSSYSIGVWTAGYLDQYDTFALPLRFSSSKTADWYCDNIPDTVGINYYIYSEQRWGWHSTRMPAGAYDPTLEMTEGFQISTSNATKFTFIGR